ncbi:MAG: 2-oxoacid:ferredoxin oxidoreductase subunit beta, partial [Melioribacteraceae bacterium]
GKHTEKDLIVHDEYDKSPVRAFILSHMTDDPDLPTPFGIFRQIEKPSYNDAMEEQMSKVTEARGKGDLETLLFSANTWEVTDN